MAAGFFVIIAVIGGMVAINLAGNISKLLTPINITAVNYYYEFTLSAGTPNSFSSDFYRSGSGFSTSAEQTVTEVFTFGDQSLAGTTVTINSITIETPGFTLETLSPNLPLTFAGDSSISVSVSVQMPSSSYTGVLTLLVVGQISSS